jgi:hypothetical protein
MEGTKAYLNKHAHKHTYICICAFRRLSPHLGGYYSLEIECFTRFVAYPITKTMFHSQFTSLYFIPHLSASRLKKETNKHTHTHTHTHLTSSRKDVSTHCPLVLPACHPMLFWLREGCLTDYSLYSPCTDRIENTAPNFILFLRAWLLQLLPSNGLLFIESLLSNGCRIFACLAFVA